VGIYRRTENWYIDFYANGQRVRQRIGPSRKLAEKILNKVKTTVIENKYLDIRKKSKVKFEALTEQYLKYAKVNKRSWERDQRSLKCLSRCFGGKQLYEITAYDIENYKSIRGATLSPASVNRELACLKHMLNKAVEWEMLETNPAKKVRLLRENNQRLRYLTHDEVQRLYSCSANHLKPIILTALFTGMRKSEILKLKWGDVDFSRGIIFVRDSKNNEAREVPMSDRLTETLYSLNHNSPYVFASDKGKPHTCIKTAFQNAVKRAKIKDFRFHDLRHTFASHLAMRGIDLIAIKELLGHKTISMTLRYAHLSPDHKKHAVNSLKFLDSHNLVTNAVMSKDVEELSPWYTMNAGVAE
jgi:integrase